MRLIALWIIAVLLAWWMVNALPKLPPEGIPLHLACCGGMVILTFIVGLFALLFRR